MHYFIIMPYKIMPNWMFVKPLLMSGVVLFLFFNISSQLLAAYYLMQMVREAKTLEEKNSVLLKPWIDTFLRERNQITNLEAFLEKNMQDFRIHGLPLSRMKNFAGQALLIAIFLSGTGACLGIIAGQTLGQILPFYILCLFGLYIHFSLAGATDMEEKKKIIKINLMDFLENQSYLHSQIEPKKPESIETLPACFSEEADRELKELLREILA